MMGRVTRPTQDGVCTIADELPLLLPQRRPGAESADPGLIPRTRESADSPRRPPDLDVLRQVLAGLRRLT
jgi:hypothetical protein